MWRDIALQNREALLAELDRYGARLAVFRELIEKGDGRGPRAPHGRGARRARSRWAPRRRAAGARIAWRQLDLAPACAGRGNAFACRAPRASPTARCCWPRSREAPPSSTSLLDSDDTRVMREALRRARRGARVARKRRARRRARHRARDGFPNKKADLFLGNAGTAFRPLTAALALADGHYGLSGVPRMHERPIGDLVDALRGRARDIDYRGTRGFPPLAIAPRVGRRRDDGSRARRRVEPVPVRAADRAARGRASARASRSKANSSPSPTSSSRWASCARFGVEVEREGWSAFDDSRGRGLRRRRARSTSRAMRPRRRTSSPRARWAAGRCASKAWGATSLQGDVRFARRAREDGRDASRWATTGSRRRVRAPASTPRSLSTSTSTSFPMRR